MFDDGFIPIKDLSSSARYSLEHLHPELITKKERETMAQIYEEVINLEQEEQSIVLLKDCYERIKLLLDNFMDMQEEERNIISLWVIGTYFYRDFNTFPRLFINAMRGSGKSRLINILEALCWNGNTQSNLTEAVLFRTAENTTTIIDEIESINNKEKNSLREMLNIGYKNGGKVQRMRKTTGKDGEKQVVETFNLYSPVALANINGFEDVLADRGILIVLEKSNDPSKVNLIEDFKRNPFVLDLKRTLNEISVCLCMYVRTKKLNNVHLSCTWNVYLQNTYTNIHNTYTNIYMHKPTSIYSKPLIHKINENEDQELPLITPELKRLFDRVLESKINGRSLEIYFPLFYLAQEIGEEILVDTLSYAKKAVEKKQKEELIENKDFSVYTFIAQKDNKLIYRSVAELTNEFRLFIEDPDEETSAEWFGRALKRLNLILDKKRTGQGKQVMIDVNRARDKLKQFCKDEKGYKDNNEA